jgi:hypothetical protein
MNGDISHTKSQNHLVSNILNITIGVGIGIGIVFNLTHFSIPEAIPTPTSIKQVLILFSFTKFLLSASVPLWLVLENIMFLDYLNSPDYISI